MVILMWACILFGVAVGLCAIFTWIYEDFYLGIEDEDYVEEEQEKKDFEKSYQDYLEVTHGDPNWIGE